MTFPANISKHRAAVMEMLEESFREPGKRSVLKTRGISMRPLIRDRDDIVIRSKAIDEIRLGELIAYRAGDILVVHRVVATAGAGADRLFYEKGDNNMYVTEVTAERILGVIVELDTGRRTLDLNRSGHRLIGWLIATYGRIAARLFRLCRTAGAWIIAPGSGPSVLFRKPVYFLLQTPIRLIARLVRRFG